ncbi:MAG TPA: ribosome maturation factor RimM [Aeromicrobium sp.]|nr:ribosome maturation factor RimM [Aeromicrobium sp.]
MTDVVRVVVGRIGRAHGVRGELAVDVRTDEPERRFARAARLHAGSRTLTVSRTRWHSGRLLVTFAEVADRTVAEALRGTLLEADVDAAERPADDAEFYDRQLIGLEVTTVGGDVVGQVASVAHHGEQDTLVIARPTSGEVLVPFVADLVPTVDLAAGFLVVADVPGLLDPEQAG